MSVKGLALKGWRVLSQPGSFIRNVIIILSGTAFAQGLGILMSPVLARMYTPEQYGKLSVYMSLLSLAALFGSLGYERAIAMEEEDDRVPVLLMLCFSITCGLTLLLTGITLIFQPLEEHYFKLGPVIYLLPIGFAGYGFYNALSYGALRSKSFGPLSKTKWIQGLGSISVQLIAPFVGFGKVGLILGDVFGRIAGLGTLFTLYRKQLLTKGGMNKGILVGMKQLAMKYKRLPLLITGSSLFNAATLQLMPLFISSYYGLEEAGGIALVDKVLGGPILLLSMSISQVFYAEAMQRSRDNPMELVSLFRNTFTRLLRFGLLPILLIAYFGSDLFVWIFGEAWSSAAHYVPVFALLYGVNFLFSPLSAILESLRLQHWYLCWNILRFVFFISGIGITTWMGASAFMTTIVYASILGVFYVGIYVMSLLAIKKFIREYERKDIVQGETVL